MYELSENKMNVLLFEATRLVDKLANTRVVSKNDLQHFGMALNDIQTEVRHQQISQIEKSVKGNSVHV